MLSNCRDGQILDRPGSESGGRGGCGRHWPHETPGGQAPPRGSPKKRARPATENRGGRPNKYAVTSKNVYVILEL